MLGPFEPRKDAVATVAKGVAACTLLAKVLYSRAFRVGRQTATKRREEIDLHGQRRCTVGLEAAGSSTRGKVAVARSSPLGVSRTASMGLRQAHPEYEGL